MSAFTQISIEYRRDLLHLWPARLRAPLRPRLAAAVAAFVVYGGKLQARNPCSAPHTLPHVSRRCRRRSNADVPTAVAGWAERGAGPAQALLEALARYVDRHKAAGAVVCAAGLVRPLYLRLSLVHPLFHTKFDCY